MPAISECLSALHEHGRHDLRQIGLASALIGAVLSAACGLSGPANAAGTVVGGEPPAEAAPAMTSSPSSPQCLRDDLFVIVSAATLREDPDPAAKPLAVMPIGTALSGVCEQGEWRRVWAPGVAGLIGWVRADLLGREAPTYEGLRKQYDALREDDLDARKTYAERMVALAPTRTAGHEALIAVLEKTGDEAALHRAREALTAVRLPKVARLPGEERLLLVVDHGFISPLATFGPAGIAAFEYDQAHNEIKGVTDAQPTYFRPLRALHYYRRGGHAGLLRVLRREEASCDSMMASVEVAGAESAVEVTNGLATNFPLPLPPRAPDPPEQPNESERTRIVTWMEAALRKQGLRADQARDVIAKAQGEEDGLHFHVARARPGGARMLIGLLNTDAPGEGYTRAGGKSDGSDTIREVDAIVIAEDTGKGRYALTHDAAMLNPDGDLGVAYHFLDYLDIDGDGRSELLFIRYGYEWWWYEVWKRQGKAWKAVASGGGGGC